MSSFCLLSTLILFSVTFQCGVSTPIGNQYTNMKEGEVWSRCTICRKIVTKVLNSIGSSANTGEINAAFDKICEKLGSAKTFCNSLLKMFKKRLVDGIARSAGNSSQTCKYVKLCK